MKAALTRRIFRVEQRSSVPPRTHFIWQEPGEGAEVIEARKQAMIRSGQARALDRFITVGWDAPNVDKS